MEALGSGLSREVSKADVGVPVRYAQLRELYSSAMPLTRRFHRRKDNGRSWLAATVRGGDWDASALTHAVFRGDAAMAEFLLDHGVDWQLKHGLAAMRWARSAEPQ